MPKAKRNGASVYAKDLGTKGVKFPKVAADQTKQSADFRVRVNQEERRRREERKERFQSTVVTKTKSATVATRERLVGRNMNLEKAYLRLTDHPRAEDVRPLPVLQRALQHIKNRYSRDEDLEWANEQLKSLRQDMTVQGIRIPWSLDVYETHARILLEHGDLNEFNQCQTMIRTLTEGGVGDEYGDDYDDCRQLEQSPKSSDEFRGYAILYALVRNAHVDLKKAYRRAVPYFRGDRDESCAEFARQVVESVQNSNSIAFFRLYDSAPYMAAYLMDFLVKRVRDDAYNKIVAAFRPDLGVKQVGVWLGIERRDEVDRYLTKKGAVLVEKEHGYQVIDCKESLKGTMSKA